jgi:two-component system, sensor histidine kinase and response regulator
METILLVDDEPEQLRSLKIGLGGQGYHILEDVDGQAALQRLDSAKPGIDMVITDYSMSGMNGLELLSRVKERLKTLPVIMMTAYGETSLVIDALKNQCDGFIEKPFTLDALVSEIDRIKSIKLSNIDSHDVVRQLPRLVHQINNPLMAIAGNAELSLVHQSDQKGLTRRLERIIHAVEKIGAINKEILHLGRPLEEKSEPVDIVDVIEESLTMFSGLLSLKNVAIERELDTKGLTVNGSKQSLEQAVKNLLMNAIDAMDEKPIKVLKVGAGSLDEGRRIQVRVADTGWGIPEDVIPRIFDSYFSRKKNGNGLGLAVVKEMIARHGGQITVESTVDEGTCFVIELPSADGAQG